MKVETRFRDIPFEDARKCAAHLNSGAWATYRGTAIVIQTPPLEHARDAVCDGPYYLCVSHHNKDPKYSGKRFVVCPHIAEIGD